MFTKLLIANRGEIACRVMRTARRMDIACVAVYSEADREALHVEMADEAYPIGPAPARASYLSIDNIIAAARQSGAEAVHPGYGFLSENAAFAEACAAAGVTFVGPPPAAIREMGSKSAAKALMEAHGVPVVPGYHGDDQSADRLLAEAERIGFPVLLKASAGGGGRGMRVVAKPGEFAAALDGAKREAASAFGDDRMLIERYLARPRHIEVQVFADTHGNTIHLFERDCSIQRRHQKIIEEAPAPGLDPSLRQAFGAAAVAAARAVDYVGAGTVEFIMPGDDPGAFYFMEMNTRLQVEHPVTEAITGLDLVQWQLRVAAGERLPLKQEEVALRGHAIEARLYAENPRRNFLPATGTLHGLAFPPAELARVDTGVRHGDAVTTFYDPMIAKIIATGEDREAARIRLGRALAATGVLGVATNLDFLGRVAADPDFAAGQVDTGFIERHHEQLFPPPEAAPDAAVAAAALAVLGDFPADVGRADRFSPWRGIDGWRLHGQRAPRSVLLRHRDSEIDNEITITAMAMPAGSVGTTAWRLLIDGRTCIGAALPSAAEEFAFSLDGIRKRALLLRHAGRIAVFLDGASWEFDQIDPLAPPPDAALAGGRLTAPMPGRVIQLLVTPGDIVRQAQPLMVIEAMKMEHTIAAPRDGTVASVRYAAGDLVEEGAELIVLAEGRG